VPETTQPAESGNSIVSGNKFTQKYKLNSPKNFVTMEITFHKFVECICLLKTIKALNKII